MMRNQQKYENLTYLALWSLLFIAPVLSLYIRTTTDSQLEFNWDEMLMVWRKLLFFLAVFLLHNFLLAPLLVYRGRRWTYFALVAVIVAAFAVWQCTSHPDRRHFGPHPTEQGPPPVPFDDLEHEQHGPRPHNDKRPPIIMGERDIVSVIVLILMLGMNLGVKLYFKQRRDQQQMAELERQNLERQLEYLRYQINPHFFMNTLNNIHALVDINPEEAKHTILELSKMMRYVLYEGNKQGVQLYHELDFIRHYVALMQLRYTDKVRIDIDLPREVPDYEVPPLILVTFIENAFKHGVSYQRESFVEVKVSVEGDGLRFTCRNSKGEAKSAKPANEKGGIGLANVRKRLNLLFGHDYALKIKDTPDVYTVELLIPLKS